MHDNHTRLCHIDCNCCSYYRGLGPYLPTLFSVGLCRSCLKLMHFSLSAFFKHLSLSALSTHGKYQLHALVQNGEVNSLKQSAKDGRE